MLSPLEIRDLFEGAQFVLDESRARKFEGVLATVKGPFGITEETNRNGRVYTNEFWDHVLGKAETKKRLSERAVLGELEHPNSIQAKLGHISHVVTELKVIPDKHELYGEADILDTPSGRILHTLFKAGVKVGISSRGAGTLEEKKVDGETRKYVKAEDFVFGGFDFVSDPSAQNAFPKLSEGQIASLIEALQPHVEQIRRDTTGFYGAFLERLGVSGVAQDRVDLSEGTDLDTEDADLEAQEATITDLRSRLRQMVERHREMVSQMARMQEQIEAGEDYSSFATPDLTRVILSHQTKAQSLGQQVQEIRGELEAARRQLSSFQEKDQENRRGMVRRERALSREIEALKERVEKSNQSLEERNQFIKGLEAQIEGQKALTESKADKIGAFRKELLESLSEQFNCDLRALVEGLRPGFSPKEAVIRAVECSRTLHQNSLPLGMDLKLDGVQVQDLDGADDPRSTALKERRKSLIRGAHGRKN